MKASSKEQNLANSCIGLPDLPLLDFSESFFGLLADLLLLDSGDSLFGLLADSPLLDLGNLLFGLFIDPLFLADLLLLDLITGEALGESVTSLLADLLLLDLADLTGEAFVLCGSDCILGMIMM